ncbi:MAG: hypothetical protein MZW92_77540 [Comamonadaceae bacterium]|nr:hypothetical protein [Comamonadaceae bacterium]
MNETDGAPQRRHCPMPAPLGSAGRGQRRGIGCAAPAGSPLHAGQSVALHRARLRQRPAALRAGHLGHAGRPGLLFVLLDPFCSDLAWLGLIVAVLVLRRVGRAPHRAKHSAAPTRATS